MEISKPPIAVRPRLSLPRRIPLTNINTLLGSACPTLLLVLPSNQCRYADVMHEVRPLISGYRLVVVYNLVQTSLDSMHSAAKLLGQRNRLTKVLAAWHRGVKKGNAGAPAFLAYKLDHEYTEASLNLDSLKGLDKMRADCLAQSCSQSDVGMYLGSCEKSLSGGCEEGGGMLKWPTVGRLYSAR